VGVGLQPKIRIRLTVELVDGAGLEIVWWTDSLDPVGEGRKAAVLVGDGVLGGPVPVIFAAIFTSVFITPVVSGRRLGTVVVFTGLSYRRSPTAASFWGPVAMTAVPNFLWDAVAPVVLAAAGKLIEVPLRWVLVGDELVGVTLITVKLETPVKLG